MSDPEQVCRGGVREDGEGWTMMVKQTNGKRRTFEDGREGQERESSPPRPGKGKGLDWFTKQGFMLKQWRVVFCEKERRRSGCTKADDGERATLTFHPGRLRAMSGCFLSIAS